MTDGSSRATRRLWAVLGPAQKRSLKLLVLVSVLTSLAELFLLASVIPFAIALSAPETGDGIRSTQWPANLLGSAAGGSVRETGMLFLLAILVASAMRMTTLRAQAYAAKSMAEHLAMKSYWNTLNRPYTEHVRSNTTQVMLTLTGRLDRVTASAILLWVSVLSQAILAFTIISAMLFVHVWATLLLVLTVVGTYSIFLWLARKLVARQSQLHSEASAAVTRVLSESLFGIRDVLLTSTQARWRDSYRKVQHALRSANERIFVTTATPRIVVECAGFAILIGIAALLVEAGSSVEALPVLAIIILGSQRLLPIAQGLYGSWSNFQSALPHLKEVLPLLERNTASETVGEEPYKLRERLELRHLRYAYPGSAEPVIRQANLTLSAGETIGIIGRTGCGKSTLLDVIMGLLHPAHGEIALDGVPLAAPDLRRWQAAIAHVPQSIYLADATVAENVALGSSGETIDAARVRNAIALAGLGRFVDSLPLGLDTEVGERGTLLSGGQRQRIGIARALYRDSDILILDEATSSLDEETEAEVIANIRSLDSTKTIIIVTHRLSSLQHCHNVYRLTGGMLEGPLSYSDLMVPARPAVACTST